MRSHFLSYQINALKPRKFFGQRHSAPREGEKLDLSSVPTNLL
jgi:hypothetical protein